MNKLSDIKYENSLHNFPTYPFQYLHDLDNNLYFQN